MRWCEVYSSGEGLKTGSVCQSSAAASSSFVFFVYHLLFKRLPDCNGSQKAVLFAFGIIYQGVGFDLICAPGG